MSPSPTSLRALLLLSLPALALALALTVPDHARADCLDGRPINAGHRGTGNSKADNPYPENTIPSLLQAIEEGATNVEFDVRMSADGVPVLMHDSSLEATTDGEGCVSAHTVAELQQLDAGAGTPMAGEGVTVPTLAEVVLQVPIDLNVEMKYDGGGACPEVSREEFAAAVLEVLEADDQDRLRSISSFDLMLLEAVRAQDPDIYLGYLALTADLLPLAVEAGFQALNLNIANVNADVVAQVHAEGLEVNVWTVDDPVDIADMFAADVDAIITNEPPRVEDERALQCDELETTGGTETTGEPGTTESAGTTDSGDMSTSAGDDDDDDDAPGTDSDDATDSDALDDAEGCGCRGASGDRRGGLAWLIMAGLALARRRPRSSR